MSMNFRFSRGYGQCQVVRALVRCCYSNTGSAVVLPQQQPVIARISAAMPDDRGGLWCFLR
jgi:hypothetical protein